MTRIITGTTTITAADTIVTLWSGLTLTEINCPPGSPVVIEGMANFVKTRLSTTSFEVELPHAGAGGTGLATALSAMTPTEVSVGTLNNRTATVIQQLDVLDANGRGLFYNLIGVTGANDPGPGKLAFDNADPALVTALYFDVLDANEGGRDVSGLIDLWSTGSVIIVRSLASTAYAAFKLVTAPTDSSGYRTLMVSAVDNDGTLADEPVAVEWRLAGADKNFDEMVADMAARTAYDAAAQGFRVLVANSGAGRAAIFVKKSATSADWSDPAYVTGAINSLVIGTVASGTPSAATITGSAPNQTLNLTLQKGDKGNTGDITGVTTFWHDRITVDTSAGAAQMGLGLVKQASVLDDTAGRLLTVGAFGAGKSVPLTAPDLSAVRPSGRYWCDSPTNGPGGNGWLDVFDLSSDAAFHRFIKLDGHTFYSVLTAGVWGGWTSVSLGAGTAVSTVGAAAYDFTGIPAGVRRITLQLVQVSTGGAAHHLVQLGTGGVPKTSAYFGAAGNTAATAAFLTGFGLYAGSANVVMNGIMTIERVSGNSWVASHSMGRSDAASLSNGGGSVTLAGELDMLRLTTVGGIDLFDAGLVNITYERG